MERLVNNMVCFLVLFSINTNAQKRKVLNVYTVLFETSNLYGIRRQKENKSSVG